MIKSYVVIRVQFEGYHFWRDAPVEVDFLKLLHRHMFHVEAKIPVTNNDRQIEFFMMQDFIKNVIQQNYPDGKLNGRSCEMVAETILIAIQKSFSLNKGISVYVFEDGENGAGCES